MGILDAPTITMSQADARYASFRDVRRNLAGKTPRLTKSPSNPIFSLGDQGSGFLTIQWPWIVNVVQDTGAVGLYGETYRIYYSTDHEDATARIGLLTATNRTGPWTDRGVIYQDTTSGNQTETQSVIWNPVENLWFMYYHQVQVAGTSIGEVTLLATSANGVNGWTRVGVVCDYPANDMAGFPANGGIGYFRPMRIGTKWFAHSLLSGGNYPRFALWNSGDGRKWMMDPRPLGFGSDQATNAMRVEWNSGTVIFWNGELWWIGLITDFSSGGQARVTYYGASPISPDLRKLLAPPVKLFNSLQAWETNPADNRSGGSLLVDTDGSLVLAYSGGTQGFGIAVGV